METIPIFSTPLGVDDASNLLPAANELFAKNTSRLKPTTTGFLTSLQSYNAIDNCLKLDGEFFEEQIKKSLTEKAENFYKAIGLDTSKLQFQITNFWLNDMSSGSTHPAHGHYGANISGCFYVDVPDGSGAIKFFNERVVTERAKDCSFTPTEYTGTYFQVQPKEGQVFFWESLLKHEVPAANFSGTRKSIAFDVTVSEKQQTSAIKMNNKNIFDYVALYSINDNGLCKNIVSDIEKLEWGKHAYHNPQTNEIVSYADDLSVTYNDGNNTKKLKSIFENCVADYIQTIPQIPISLQEVSDIRFNKYDIGTNMKPHVDHIHTLFDGDKRGIPSLTILALLNDGFEGGDFLMFEGLRLNLSAGDIVVFPSNFMYPHEVTTVTKGVRYSCVSWAY